MLRPGRRAPLEYGLLVRRPVPRRFCRWADAGNQIDERSVRKDRSLAVRDHPDLDTKPSKNPFARVPVVAARVEAGPEVADYFFVLEMNLPNDDLGPRTPPPRRSEAEARIRLAELGLNGEEIEDRIRWARKWMTTIIVPAGQKPWFLSF